MGRTGCEMPTYKSPAIQPNGWHHPDLPVRPGEARGRQGPSGGSGGPRRPATPKQVP
jgi:hypothetical protein